MEAYTNEMSQKMGIPKALLPHLVYLYQDFWSMGSSPETILALLRPHVSEEEPFHVLELGVGKGAVSVALARELNVHVQGMDIFPPFIEEARSQAALLGVEALCHFEVADICEDLEHRGPYDVVVLASLGAVWGTIADTIKAIRNVVRPGGFMVIDDSFLKHSAKSDRKGWEYYRGYKETIEELTIAGDKLQGEALLPQHALSAFNDQVTKHITKRAHILGEQYPELKTILDDYLHWEADECEVLESETTWAVWLLQRT